MTDALQTELSVAEAIRDGAIRSGTKYLNVWLFSIRITGTGLAYRLGENEFCWRDPSYYMNEEFLRRCNGLAVILEHPEKSVLDSDEYSNRNVGSVFLPFLKHEEKEVWAVAKIYDEEVASFLLANQMSTSPTVVFTGGLSADTHLLDGGVKLLIENEGALLDHVAICDRGVWDKGGAPCGVDNGSGDNAVADKEDVKSDPKDEQKEEIKEDAKKADSADDKLSAFMDSVMSRMDSMCSRMDAWEAKKADAVEPEKKADAEPEPKAEPKADAETIKKAVADAMAERLKPEADSEKDAKADAQAKCDSVYRAHNERAQPPMVGETARDYHMRLLKPLQRHSEIWKDIDLAGLPDKVFSMADAVIRADAIKAAERPTGVPEGQLIERRKKVGEHTHVEFFGTFDAGFGDFKRAPSFAKFGGLNNGKGH